MGKTAYPEILTKVKWDKEKGLIAKIVAKETGIGAMLDDLHKTYEAVPWEKLDEKLLLGTKSTEQIEKYLQEGKAVLNTQIEALRKKAIEGSRTATKVAGDLKKITLAPKSTREYLEKMSTAAVNFSSALRDEAIETLKKFEGANTISEENAEEFKKIGEAYIQNRKLAVAQMTQLKNLYIETRTRVTTMAKTCDTAANGALANPSTAGKAVTDITALHTEAVKIVQAAKDRFSKEGSLSANPVQAKARGNIEKWQGKEHPALVSYQQKSAGEFNTIMAIVAEILTIGKGLDTTISDIETSLDIAKDASTVATKSLAEHQESARNAVQTAMGFVAVAKGELDKIAKRIPLLKNVLDDSVKKPETLTSAHNTFETSVNELHRRVATIAQAANKVANLQKRISVLPQNIRADGVIKGEMDKLTGIYRNFQAAIKQGQDNTAIAEKLYTELPPKP